MHNRLAIATGRPIQPQPPTASHTQPAAGYPKRWSDRGSQPGEEEIRENPGGRNRYGFYLNLLRKIADLGGSKGGPHGRGPGRRKRAKPARQPKCCISLEKAISEGPSNANILLFLRKYCQMPSGRVSQPGGGGKSEKIQAVEIVMVLI